MGISPLLQKVEIMPSLQILAPDVIGDEEAEGPSEYKPKFCKKSHLKSSSAKRKLTQTKKGYNSCAYS